MSSLTERFIRYARVNTRSDERSPSVPSSACQFDLARTLGDELTEMGLSDVAVTENAYVFGILPPNRPAPAIGLCAHLDTAADFPGENVRPRVVENYDGGDIVLNEREGVVLSPSVFPELRDKRGQTLIVTDGNTLLGADDKAGVAEIMAALEYMAAHPGFAHGKIVVCFCPDEEIGHGAELWDLRKYGADLAYTVDGGGEGAFSYETFNAASARVTFSGISVHPGMAKDKMQNACLLAVEFANSLPPAETPEHTEGREGYYHLVGMSGGVEEAELRYIVRDHDAALFAARKERVRLLVRQMNERIGREAAAVSLRDQYFNMAGPLRKRPDIVETALEAYRQAGVEPRVVPTRGGTDGSRLSFRGLLTPNIFTGGYNAHGKYEYAVVGEMEKAVRVILNIVRLYAQGGEPV